MSSPRAFAWPMAIGQAKARGEDIEPLRLEVNKLGEQLDAAKSELETLLAEIRDIALAIPNIPPAANFNVVVFVAANRHIIMRNIRDRQRDIANFRQQRFQLGFCSIQLFAKLVNFQA